MAVSVYGTLPNQLIPVLCVLIVVKGEKCWHVIGVNTTTTTLSVPEWIQLSGMNVRENGSEVSFVKIVSCLPDQSGESLLLVHPFLPFPQYSQ